MCAVFLLMCCLGVCRVCVYVSHVDVAFVISFKCCCGRCVVGVCGGAVELLW